MLAQVLMVDKGGEWLMVADKGGEWVLVVVGIGVGNGG